MVTELYKIRQSRKGIIEKTVLGWLKNILGVGILNVDRLFSYLNQKEKLDRISWFTGKIV